MQFSELVWLRMFAVRVWPLTRVVFVVLLPENQRHCPLTPPRHCDGMFLLRLGLLLPAVNLGTTYASGASGRLCCPEGQVLTDKGCEVGGTAVVFDPPASLSPETSWSPRPLICPEGYRQHNVDLGNDSLVTHQASVELKWNDVFSRRTTEFCVAVNHLGKYIASLCRPDVQKVRSLFMSLMSKDIRRRNSACPETYLHVIRRFLDDFTGENTDCKHCVQMCCAESDFLRGLECVRNKPLPGTEATGVHVIVSTPKCDSRHFLTVYNSSTDGENEFAVDEDGALSLSVGDWHEVGTYCLARDENGIIDRAFYCARELSALVSLKNRVVKICLVVSCVFLALTIMNHALTKKLRDVQGLCFLCHMISLLVADAALICSSWFSKHISLTHCIINGFIMQYSFLATFAWINIMCFDIWRVVKATVSLVPLSNILANDAKKFRVYCALAFGLPLVIVSVTVIMQFLPTNLVPGNSAFRPKFGVTSCWFHESSGKLLYFYGPLGLFSVSSLLFLVHTLAMLFQTGSLCTCCSQKVPVTAFNRNHLEAFWQRFSLFFLSVLCWVTEVLSWLTEPPEIWIATDIINSLQGVIVFIIFFTSKKKRRIIFQSWESTMSSVVSRASKTFSRSDSAGSSS